MYGDVVMDLQAGTKEDPDPVRRDPRQLKNRRASRKIPTPRRRLQELVLRFKGAIKDRTAATSPRPGTDLGRDRRVRSWMNDRAISLSPAYGIPTNGAPPSTCRPWCSATWATTAPPAWRSPATRPPAKNGFYGELPDQRAGRRRGGRHPHAATGASKIGTLGEMVQVAKRSAQSRARRADARIYRSSSRKKLENHYRDVQDIEFTIQKARLWMLQTRNAKRTGFAAVRIAVDMVNEGLITRRAHCGAWHPGRSEPTLQPMFDPKAQKAAKVMAQGSAGVPGAATGQIVFLADDADEWAEHGKTVILVRRETTPEDLRGMRVGQGHSHGAAAA